MSEHLHTRGHRTRHARAFLAIVFFGQRIADAAVIWFAFQPANSTLLLRGVAVGSCLSTTVLLICAWRRLGWARYLLVTFNWGFIALFGFEMLQTWDQKPQPNPSLALVAGVALYGLANLVLLRSRRVRHHASF
jgi:uncharacterized membrane-anchored protein YitT (DUF2179 family)